MNTLEPATLGAVLILFGLALAFLAVYVVLNRRVEGSDDAEESAPDLGTGESPDLTEDEAESASVPAAEVGEAEAIEQQPKGDDSQEGEDPEGEEGIAESEVLEAPEPVPQLELMHVLDVYREEVSGEIVLRIADREYRSAEEIEDDGHRRRIEFALADLGSWFSEPEDRPAPIPKVRKPSPDTGFSTSENGGTPSRESGPAMSRRGSATSPKSSAETNSQGMIDGINAFLRTSLDGDDGGPRALRLVSDASGGVRVLIGLKSYPLDDIPDEDIRRLIRQAVEEWEASQ